MRNKLSIMCMLFAMLLFLSSCGGSNLARMTGKDTGDYYAIVWEDREYVPFCVVTKKECGNQIGIMADNKDDRIYEFKNHSSDEWIISFPKYEGGGLLFREITVTDIPDGLTSEYEWNNLTTSNLFYNMFH